MADDTSTGSTRPRSGTKRSRATAAKKTPSAAQPAVATSTAGPKAPTRGTAPASGGKITAAKRTAAGGNRKPAAGAAPASIRRSAAPKADVILAPAALDSPVGRMTPTIAVSRHLEWLDYALAAARAEESWRRDRLAKATKSNLAKRETRLADVLAEIVELSALITGLRALQRGAPATKSTRSRSTTPSRATRTASRSRQTTDTGAG
jgi:hypothetical protein